MSAKRLNLKIVIPLLVIVGVIAVVGLLAANNKSTPAGQKSGDVDLSSESQVQDSADIGDDKNSIATEGNQDVVTTNEDSTVTDHMPSARTAAAAEQANPKTTAEKPEAEAEDVELDLQLALNFYGVLVETSIEASESYYVSAKKPTCGGQDAVQWIKVVNGEIEGLKHGSWVCVRARTDSGGSYKYQSMQIDLTKPTISFHQKLSSIFVSTQPSHVANIDYFQSKTKPNCGDQAKLAWRDLSGEELKNVKDDYWVCLRAQIRTDSVFGYKLLQVDSDIKPEVDLSQKGSRVSVQFSLQPVYDAGWFRSKSKPECSDKNLSASWQELPAEGISGFSDGDWICVRGASTAYGYQLIRVNLSKPTVDLKREGNHIVFAFDPSLLKTDPDIAERAYWGRVFNQKDCHHNNKNIVWQQLAGGLIGDLEYGQYWICIHLTSSVGIENYQTFGVNLQKPPPPPTLLIEAVQHNNTFHLTFSQEEVSNKRYTAVDSEPNCQTAIGYAAVPRDEVLLNLDVGDWVCVVATFRDKEYYLKQEVLRPPLIRTTQYALEGFSPQSNNIKRAVLEPTFSPAEVQSQQYAITASRNCEGADWLPLQTSFTFTATDTVCLRVRDNQGVWSDLVYQYVSEDAPTYSNILARKVTVTWPAVDARHYFVNSQKPRDCDRSRSDNWIAVLGNTATINLISNGDWVCFRTTKTQNSQTVVSFFEHQHLHTPTISIVQHGSKTIAPEHDSAPLGIVKYHFISRGSECSENTTSNWSQTATYITADNANAYVCLQLQDGPITTYRSYQLKTVSAATINISSKTMRIIYPTTTSPEAIKAKRYFTSSSEPACDQTTTSRSWTTTTNAVVALINQSNGIYLCTSTIVENSTADYELIGYSKKRLVIQPTASFASQNENVLTISFSPTDASSKRYYTAAPGADNEPVCTDADTTTRWTTIAGSTLTLEADTPAGQWVCVKVSDGPFSAYAVKEFQRESPAADIVQSNYKFYVSPGSNRTCDADDDDEIVECKYFKSENNPDCTASLDSPNESNQWNTFSAGILSDTYSADQYICVKLKNNRGYSTYSERKAITMVVLAIYEQTSRRIRVQYQYGTVALGTAHYYTQATEPTCDYTTLGKRNKHIPNNWTYDIPEGYWVCISVGNYNIGIKHQAWSFLKVKDI